MEFIDPKSAFTFRLKLRKGITYVSVWDLNFRGGNRPERVMEFVEIGRGIRSFALWKPLLVLNPPVPENGPYDKREFAHWLEEETEARRPLLDRYANVLETQIKRVLVDGAEIPAAGNRPKKSVWMKVPAKWTWAVDLLDSLFGEDGGDAGFTT